MDLKQYLINQLYFIKLKQNAIHSVKMLQWQNHGNHKQLGQWAIALKAKLRESVTHFQVSKGIVSKMMSKNLYILLLGDARTLMWCRYGEPSYAELLLTQREAYGEYVRIFWGSIPIMAGQRWCVLIGHWMTQSAMKKSWPVTWFSLVDDNCTPHNVRLITA